MKIILAVIISIPLAAFAADSGKKAISEFESSAGYKYQYDLRNPADEVRYKNDVGAQLRDEIKSFKYDPRKEILEDAYGQKGRGAGIYDD